MHNLGVKELTEYQRSLYQYYWRLMLNVLKACLANETAIYSVDIETSYCGYYYGA